MRATPSFFRLVGVQPLKAACSARTSERGKDRKVLLSYGFWQRKFGGADSAVGASIRLNGAQYDVVGVLPLDFSFIQSDTDLYMPAAFGPDDKSDERRHNNNWQMVGRLKAGASLTQVKQQVDLLNAHNDERFPQFRQILKDARFQTVVVLLQDDRAGRESGALSAVGGVLFVLVIGGVNIANLVLVRSSARSGEGHRHALGATSAAWPGS